MWSLGLLPALVVATAHPEWGPFPPVAPFGLLALPAQRAIKPMIFPVIGAGHWNQSYGEIRQGYRHTGVDIRAPKMSPIVAPFAGKLGLKRESFWIYGDDGWAILGTHLNDDNPGKNDHKGSRDLMFAPDLVPGQRVKAGQLIGYVGQSGNATGPHLHFELYAPGKGLSMARLRNPTPSLHLAQKIAAPRPTTVAGCPTKTQMRLQGCVRKVDGKTGKVTIILVSKQFSNGKVVAASKPRYLKLWVKPQALENAGGLAALRSLPATTPVGFIVPAKGDLNGISVSKLILPKRSV